MVFDGDQRPAVALPESGALPQGISDLRALIEKYTAGNDAKGPGLDFVNSRDASEYVEFLRRHVLFLPSQTPESLVWSDTQARQMCSTMPREISKESDLKKKMLRLAEAIPGYDENTVFRILLNAFLANNSTQRQQLRDIVRSIRGHVTNSALKPKQIER